MTRLCRLVLATVAAAGLFSAASPASVSLLLDVGYMNRGSLAVISAELASFAASCCNASLTVEHISGAAYTGLAICALGPPGFEAALRAALTAPPSGFASASLVSDVAPDVLMSLNGGAPGGTAGLASNVAPDILMSLNGGAPGGIAIPPAYGAGVGVLSDVAATATQPLPSYLWHLARISSRSAKLDGVYEYALDGATVDMYIVDGGINLEHVEFAGRIQPGFNAVSDQPAGDTEDCFGHGTHVSGLAAGTTYGVAKLSSIIPVRVYGCSDSGPVSAILQGVNFILARMSTTGAGRRAVINMSFGGGQSIPLDVSRRVARSRILASRVARRCFAYGPALALP